MWSRDYICMMRTAQLALALVFSIGVGIVPLAATMPAEVHDGATVSVECSIASGLIQLQVLHHRRIGKVEIEVRDSEGDLVYLEVGKAMGDELVRRLDKGMFPKGEATLRVKTRDFDITRPFLNP